jgi:hypothetical protein
MQEKKKLSINFGLYEDNENSTEMTELTQKVKNQLQFTKQSP